MSNCGRPIEKQTQETWHEICACLLATQACNSCSDQASLKPVLWLISQCNCQVAPASLSLLFFSLPGFLWNNPKTRKTREAWAGENSECQRMQKLTLDHSSYGKLCEDGMTAVTPFPAWLSAGRFIPTGAGGAGGKSCPSLGASFTVKLCWMTSWSLKFSGMDGTVPCATARIIFVNHIRFDWLHGSIVGL